MTNLQVGDKVQIFQNSSFFRKEGPNIDEESSFVFNFLQKWIKIGLGKENVEANRIFQG